MLDRYEPVRPMTEWLTKKEHSTISTFVRDYGPFSAFRQWNDTVRDPRMSSPEAKELMNSREIYTLFSKIIEIDERHKTGELQANNVDTWRFCYAFLKRWN